VAIFDDREFFEEVEKARVPLDGGERAVQVRRIPLIAIMLVPRRIGLGRAGVGMIRANPACSCVAGPEPARRIHRTSIVALLIDG
jgi:hypothetical protein